MYINKDFEIKLCYGDAIISKNGIAFSVEKGTDDDIWFNTRNNMEISLNYRSRIDEEYRTYLIFESLMKSIIGRYILEDNSCLPKDFIDLDNKTITWHSDSDLNYVLKLCYSEKIIKILLYKIKEDSYNDIKVRVRTSGSSYGQFYHEFEKFFRELSRYAELINEKNSSKTR